MAGPVLSEEQRAKILEKDLENCVAAALAGKPLTPQQRRLIEQAKADEEAAPLERSERTGNLRSINELAELTGKDRRTVTTRLGDIPATPGPKGAHLYHTPTALAAIYGIESEGASLEEAKRDQARETAALAKARREMIQRTTIPVEIVIAIWGAALQSFAATLKAAKGKELTPEKINELLEILRSAKLPETW